VDARTSGASRALLLSLFVAAAGFGWGGGAIWLAAGASAGSLPARPAADPQPSATSAPTPVAGARRPAPTPPATRALSPAALLAALPDWGAAAPFHVLLLGIDERGVEQRVGQPGRTDVMVLVRVAPAERRVALVSLPRDLLITLPGVGETKLNTAYTYGEVRLRGGGPSLAKAAVADLIGRPVEHHAVVDFTGFARAVDLLEGIEVDVTRPLKDDEYPTADYGVERMYLPVGPQWMDGAMALRYARSRHTDSDFGRMRRQQEVLLALRKRALRWASLSRAPELAEQALAAVRSDLGPREALALAKLASQVDPAAVKSLVVAPPLVEPGQGRDGSYVLRLDQARFRSALTAVLGS
jgi:LCP family protein required for cell wall assembly